MYIKNKLLKKYLLTSNFKFIISNKILDISRELNGNTIRMSPHISNNLIILNISYNNIDVILSLPPILKLLNCSNNNLKELPQLPYSLKELNIDNNQFKHLNINIPNLIKLRCCNNLLTNLSYQGSMLPLKLEELWCFNNKLEHLPKLPPLLTTLICNHNELIYLPKLPPTLIKLGCVNNRLTTLPILPNSLTGLFCDNNQIFIFPIISNRLKSFSYYNNPIIYNSLYNSYEINNISYINNTNLILYNFKFRYYLIKYKNNFHKWLWRSREYKIMQEFHPDNIVFVYSDDECDCKCDCKCSSGND